MTDIITVAIIAAVPPTLVGLLNIWSSLRNRKAIIRVELATNGMSDKLLEASKLASHAEGMAAQRKEDRDNK